MDMFPLGSIIWRKEQETSDGMKESAADAVHAGGCLQWQWRQDGRGSGKWGYTTHPGYCFAETVTDADGNIWHYDASTNSYSTGF